MTDEEKAEEYIRTDGTNGEKAWGKIHKEFPKCIVVKTTKSKERLSELLLEYTKAVYLDGLAEGRKDREEQIQIDIEWIDKLEKENAELNRDKTELVNSVTELKIKVTELEAQLKNNPYVQILQKEKAELAEDFAKQIEKMKNVGNCNKAMKCSKWVEQHIQGNKVTCCWGCVEWESAE